MTPRHSLPKLNLVVLISGGGTNLQSLIDAIQGGELHAEIRAVLSNEPEAYGLERAKKAGIPTCVLSHRDYLDRSAYDADLAEKIEYFQPDYLILAGFMRILSSGFVQRFQDRILNIHPALLPKFKGTNTHQRALDAGEIEHGATVHLVTEKLDDGPNLLQASVSILEGETAETLRQRVLKEEHRIYPAAIQKLATGEMKISDGQIIWTHNETE
ncbi:MAG: phosphoribosylglycinamide formyltransferase [Acidiferrobacterales bacterium]|nr:phosphoribosylglycinamide formyltransferase [Acidiferrobacterales bacterium]